MRTLPPEFFRRQDEAPDELFYAVPRAASHLDEAADAVVAGWYAELLPPGGAVLDLLAGEASHLPGRFTRVVGVGLDETALARNPRLTEHHRWDVNARPSLPLPDACLDGAVCTVSVQYLTHPVAVFEEVGRCLRPGAPFLVAFSNRMFPTKAVLCWRASDDAAHARLVRTYFETTERFGPTVTRSHLPGGDGAPLYLVGAATRTEEGAG